MTLELFIRLSDFGSSKQWWGKCLVSSVALINFFFLPEYSAFPKNVQTCSGLDTAFNLFNIDSLNCDSVAVIFYTNTLFFTLLASNFPEVRALLGNCKYLS